ncbi:MAG: hypothetical protein KF813_05490 [Trueperaceae bacterium]|nr:hypothetical protein [Trueperaceae bacterium]
MARAFTAALALLAVTWVSAASVLVYPLDSQEPLVGMALADEIAAQLAAGAVVLGPEVAAGAVPPVIVADGFVSLERLVGVRGMGGAAGADMLRTGTGVDVAATGALRLRDDGAWLELHVAFEGGSRTVELRADSGRLDRLVSLAANVIVKVVEEATGERIDIAAAPALPTRSLLQLASGPDSAYGGYVTALAYVAAGLLEDAAFELSELIGAPGVPARASEVREDVQAVLDTAAQPVESLSATRLARRALLGIVSPVLSEQATLAGFDAFGSASGLALADAWAGVIAASVNDRARSTSYLSSAAEALPYGKSLYAALLAARGDAAYTALLDEVVAEGRDAGSAALLGASVIANARADSGRERDALQHLRRSSPFLTYPLERLSYLAFDANEPQLAAEVLSVAVELEPDSDLYWTNLGWSYYLLGFLARSEEASLRALALDASQYIASYNIGLVRVSTGRLTHAMDAYYNATRRDPGIDDEAIIDLENARVLYPDQVAVEYALAYLYQADGRRSDARGAYERFLARAGDSAEADLTPFVELARAQLSALSAPLPALEVIGPVRVTLGIRGSEASPFHPGDPIYPSFELSTPGDSLPARVSVWAALVDGATDAEIVADEFVLELPPGAVAYVVDGLELLLPTDLPAGDYVLRFSAGANEEQSVAGETALTVAGVAQPLRGLMGRGLMMTALESGSPLYNSRMLQTPEALLDVLLRELAATADAAEQALPRIESGRFAGLSGGEAFLAATADDVDDFLDYLLRSGARDSRFVFVDAFAQWLLEGSR